MSDYGTDMPAIDTDAVRTNASQCPKCGYEGNYTRRGVNVWCDGPDGSGRDRCGHHYHSVQPHPGADRDDRLRKALGEGT